MNTSHRLIIGTVVLAGVTGGLAAQGPDWPQWRGPRRDGTLTAFTEPKVWPDALKQHWKITVGEGYATPILVGNRVFQFSRQGENEILRAIDAASGKIIWEKSYAAPFEMTSGTKRHGPGPKSTPTYADGRIFTLGMSSIVTAWDAATGKELWRIPAGPLQPQFHTAMSPFVEKNQMILHLGGDKQGTLNSFDPATGKVRWSWTGDGPAYGSPIIAEIDGTRHLMLFSQRNFIGVNPETGALLWSVPFEARSTTNSITPLVTATRSSFRARASPLPRTSWPTRAANGSPTSRGKILRYRCRSATACSSATPCSRCRRSTAASSSGPTRRRGRPCGCQSLVKAATRRLRGRAI